MKKTTKIALVTSAFMAVTTVSATFASGTSESIPKALVNQLVEIVNQTKSDSEQEIDRIQTEANQGAIEKLRGIYQVIEQDGLSDEELLSKTNDEILSDISQYAQIKAQEGVEAGQANTDQAVKWAEEMIAMDIANALQSENTDINDLINEVAQLKSTNGALKNQVNSMSGQIQEGNQAQAELDEVTNLLREQIQSLGYEPCR